MTEGIETAEIIELPIVETPTPPARTAIVEARPGLIIPAFHDAHLHLLEYARAASTR